MKKWIYTVCGYVCREESAPEKCPQCGVPAPRFEEQVSKGIVWTCEHEAGTAQDVPEDIMMGLRANFGDECSEVGMYLIVSRVAHREGYPKIGAYWTKAAFEEAERAARLTELLGGVVTPSTKRSLEMRVAVENGAIAGKLDLTKRAKALNLDVIHDTVHEMARDEAHHSKAFESLLNGCFS